MCFYLFPVEGILAAAAAAEMEMFCHMFAVAGEES